jgi:hypothetical protein
MLANRRDSSSQLGSALGYRQFGSDANLEPKAIGQGAAAREGHAGAARDESDYWRGDKGQFSNPFLCRS